MKAITTRPLLAIALTLALGGTAFAVHQASASQDEPAQVIEQVEAPAVPVNVTEEPAVQPVGPVEEVAPFAPQAQPVVAPVEPEAPTPAPVQPVVDDPRMIAAPEAPVIQINPSAPVTELGSSDE